MPAQPRIERGRGHPVAGCQHVAVGVGQQRQALAQPRRHAEVLQHVLQRVVVLSDASGNVLAAGDRVASAAFDAWLRGHGASIAWIP